MPQRTKDSAADRTFGALSNPTRRDILDLLLEGPHSAADIASRFEMARPSVSEHLEVLRDAGLVTVTKSGRFRYYEVEPEPLHELQQWLTPYERFWRDRMAAFGGVLDELERDDTGSERTS